MVKLNYTHFALSNMFPLYSIVHSKCCLICFLSRVSYSEANKLFTVQEDGEGPEIKLHQVMEEVRKGRGVRWDAGAWQRKAYKHRYTPEEDVPEERVVQLEKNEVQEVRTIMTKS